MLYVCDQLRVRKPNGSLVWDIHPDRVCRYESIARYILLFEPYKHVFKEQLADWYEASPGMVSVCLTHTNAKLKQHGYHIQGFDTHVSRTAQLFIKKLD